MPRKKKIYDISNIKDLSDTNPDETPDTGIHITRKKDKVVVEDDIQEFNIHELDMNNLNPKSIDDPDGVKLVIIGAPGKGKGVIVKSYLYAKKHIFPSGQFFSGTEESNGSFGKFAPSLFINNGLGDYTLSWDNYHKRQQIAMKYLDNPWNIRVEDDCTTDTKIFNKPTYHDVFKNDRHRKSAYFLCLQYALDIKPAIRNCIDGTFICSESSPKSRKILLENYVPILKNMNELDAVMDTICVDYTSLFVNKKTQSSSIEDILFYYKADKKKVDTLDQIKFGCDTYWHFSDQRCKPPTAF